ncbi:MAG: precorrin-2 dehydrogenase/sirohydrochlorin ferrochelatase family protein, partial [Acetobacteraceae bacterium]
MIPISLDPRALSLALAGAGAGLVRRLALLRAGGGEAVAVFSPDPAPEIARAAGPLLRPRLPGAEEIAGFALLWIVGLPASEAAPLAGAARAARVLVNVEDVPALCDFHNAAELRRGDLLLAISTGGRAPGLAAALRRGEVVDHILWRMRQEVMAPRMMQAALHSLATAVGAAGCVV